MVIVIIVAVTILYLPNVEKAYDTISDFLWQAFFTGAYYLVGGFVLWLIIPERLQKTQVIEFIVRIIAFVIYAYWGFLLLWSISLILNFIFSEIIMPFINSLIGQ